MNTYKVAKLNSGNIGIISDTGLQFCKIVSTGEIKENAQFPTWLNFATIEASNISEAVDKYSPELHAAQQELDRMNFMIQSRDSQISKLQEALKSPAKIKRALASAEKSIAREKLEKKVKSAAIKAAASLAKKSPKSPLKGIGHSREMWPFNGHNKIAEIVCSAIPSNHKTSVTTSRRAKGYFSFGLAISTEAAKKMIPLVEKFSK